MIMSAEEARALLAEIEGLDIREFIKTDENGNDRIDVEAVRKCRWIRGWTLREGELIAFELQNGQKAHQEGNVYLIQAQNGLVKIGISDNINRRFSALNTASPIELTLLAVKQTPIAQLMETELHEQYADRRERGEWFRLTADEIETIVSQYGFDKKAAEMA